jgi:hypothetical protein
MSYDDQTPGVSYEGIGETLALALTDAATKAVEDSRDNVGRSFDLVRHRVVVDNPRISEHRVLLVPSGP